MRKEGFYQVPEAGFEPARLIQPTDLESVVRHSITIESGSQSKTFIGSVICRV